MKSGHPDQQPAACFKDHFSGNAEGYSKFRPDYPAQLFSYLASISPARNRAWDCATGSGQAAVKLSDHFREVIATDASSRQLQHAQLRTNVSYLQANASHVPLADNSIDLITVAQALHWFDTAAFFAEVLRVLVPNGLLAIWSYNLLNITPEINRVIGRFYHQTMGPYWPPERALVASGYKDIALPFKEIEPPPFHMRADWTLDHLLGYLGTWSAVKRYREAHHHDPVALITGVLSAAWGGPDQTHEVTWPLTLRIGRKIS